MRLGYGDIISVPQCGDGLTQASLILPTSPKEIDKLIMQICIHQLSLLHIQTLSYSI